MAEHWSDEYLTQIEDCAKRGSKLTEWEVTFLDSLGTQIERGRIPTPKQVEQLDRIWERVT